MVVAKDYQYYLVVKRANCSPEEQTVSSNVHPAKEVEVCRSCRESNMRYNSFIAVCTPRILFSLNNNYELAMHALSGGLTDSE